MSDPGLRMKGAVASDRTRAQAMPMERVLLAGRLGLRCESGLLLSHFFGFSLLGPLIFPASKPVYCGVRGGKGGRWEKVGVGFVSRQQL